MSAWRDMFARFRKDNAPHTNGDHVAVAEPSVDTYSTPAPEVLVEEMSVSQRQRETDKLLDDTRALANATPQLFGLHNERFLGVAALRDIGRERHENQDHCFGQIMVFPTDTDELVLGLFVVADGMGGHHDGGYASKLALTTVVQTVLTEFLTPLIGGERPTPQPVMQAAVQAANAAVYETAQSAGTDMGTTCTATLLYGSELITAHVGDSRALLLGSGVKLLTTDHSAIGRLIAIGALTTDEARDHPLRNQLYRSIGQQAHVDVDVTTTSLQGESHLVLCSDGLWGLVPEAEITDIVAEAPSAQVAARHLIARANLLGGHDNISAVVVALPAHAGSHQ